jgi:hypothetical protein
MDHPRLIAALADDDRHRQCPCGAVAEPSERLCRKCDARMAWRRKTTRTSRRAARRLAAHQIHEGTRILASAMALLQVIGKGVES